MGGPGRVEQWWAGLEQERCRAGLEPERWGRLSHGGDRILLLPGDSQWLQRLGGSLAQPRVFLPPFSPAAAADIQIVKRSDGSDWSLGSGGFGKVGCRWFAINYVFTCCSQCSCLHPELDA